MAVISGEAVCMADVETVAVAPLLDLHPVDLPVRRRHHPPADLLARREVVAGMEMGQAALAERGGDGRRGDVFKGGLEMDLGELGSGEWGRWGGLGPSSQSND